MKEPQNQATVEPVKSWVDSGGMHYIQAADLDSIEDYSVEDDAATPQQHVGMVNKKFYLNLFNGAMLSFFRIMIMAHFLA